MDDPLFKMPAVLRQWAEKNGLDKLLRRYGFSVCEVCGRIGYHWTTEWLPVGINLEFESPIHGWIHPKGDGWDGAEGGFRNIWEAAESEARKERQELSEALRGLEGSFFDLFMKGVCNTIDPSQTFVEMNGAGRTNPFDMCVSGRAPFGTRQGGKKGVCPKCGEPGTGEGVVGGERRFFHGPNKSCYLGMSNPIRKRVEEVKCPKCGQLGRESVSKGYRYIRHKDKVCYLGKISNEST